MEEGWRGGDQGGGLCGDSLTGGLVSGDEAFRSATWSLQTCSRSLIRLTMVLSCWSVNLLTTMGGGGTVSSLETAERTETERTETVTRTLIQDRS